MLLKLIVPLELQNICLHKIKQILLHYKIIRQTTDFPDHQNNPNKMCKTKSWSKAFYCSSFIKKWHFVTFKGRSRRTHRSETCLSKFEPVANDALSSWKKKIGNNKINCWASELFSVYFLRHTQLRHQWFNESRYGESHSVDQSSWKTSQRPSKNSFWSEADKRSRKTGSAHWQSHRRRLIEGENIRRKVSWISEKKNYCLPNY